MTLLINMKRIALLIVLFLNTLSPTATFAQSTFTPKVCTTPGGKTITCNTEEECLAAADAVAGTVCSTPSNKVSPGSFGQTLFPNTNGHFIPDACTGVDPNVQNTVQSCGINEILQVVLNVSRLILGVLGSVTLVMFIYGGVIFLTSAGSAQRVQQGKTILLNAVIGVIIVIFAWVLVSSLVGTITGTGLSNPKIFGTDEPLTIPGR